LKDKMKDKISRAFDRAYKLALFHLEHAIDTEDLNRVRVLEEGITISADYLIHELKDETDVRIELITTKVTAREYFFEMLSKKREEIKNDSGLR